MVVDARSSISLSRAAIKDCWYTATLWLSLPFSIWVAGGWTGLVLHWQTINRVEKRDEETQETLNTALFERCSQSLAGEP